MEHLNSTPEIKNTIITDLSNSSVPFDLVASMYQTKPSVHVLCIAIILTLGLIGNIFVMHMYSKKQHFKVHNIYIITLSVIDMFACVFVSPQVAFLHFYDIQQQLGYPEFMELYIVSVKLVVQTYFAILVFIAIERVRIVFSTGVHIQSIKKSVIKMVCITITSIIISVSSSVIQFEFSSGLGKAASKIMLVTIAISSFFILVISYLAILHKLNKRSRHIGSVVKPKEDRKAAHIAMIAPVRTNTSQNNW